MKNLKQFEDFLNEGWMDNMFPHLDIYVGININNIKDKITEGLDRFGYVKLKVFREAEAVFLQIKDEMGLFARKATNYDENDLGRRGKIQRLTDTENYRWVSVSRGPQKQPFKF